MVCDNCGAPLNEGSTFCPNCGTAIPKASEPDMTTKQWVGTIILTSWFGIISIIILFVYAFGNGPIKRKTYAKAMLIFQAILLTISLLLTPIWFTAIKGLSDGFMRGWNSAQAKRNSSISLFVQEPEYTDDWLITY